MKAFFLILFLGLTGVAQAQSTDPLPQLIDQALAHNPGWAAKGHEVAAFEAGVVEANGWANPKLTLGQTIDPVSRERQSYQVSLMQALPFLGETGFKEEAAQAQALAAGQRQAMARRRLIRQVKAAYYDLWKMQEVTKLLQENQQALTRMTEIGGYESQRNAGMMSEVYKSQAMMGENAFELLEMQNGFADAQARMSNLLGGRLDPNLLPLAEPPAPAFQGNLANLLQEAKAQSPSLAEAQYLVQAANAKADRLSRAGWLPRLELEVAFLSMGSPQEPTMEASTTSAYMVSLGMMLPFGSSALEGQRQRALAEQLRQAEWELQKINDLQEEVTNRYHQVINAQQLLTTFEKVLMPAVKRDHQLTEGLYAAGQKNMGAALQAKINYLTMEIRHIKAKVNYLKALADLEELVTTPHLLGQVWGKQP